MYIVKKTKRVSRREGEGKRLPTEHDSQEMQQGNDYKDFLKNNLNRSHETIQ